MTVFSNFKQLLFDIFFNTIIERLDCSRPLLINADIAVDMCKQIPHLTSQLSDIQLFTLYWDEIHQFAEAYNSTYVYDPIKNSRQFVVDVIGTAICVQMKKLKDWSSIQPLAIEYVDLSRESSRAAILRDFLIHLYETDNLFI